MLQKDIFINEKAFIRDTFKKLDKTALKVLLVVNGNNELLGTVTDGDIRRYILSGQSLENDITKIYNRQPIYIKKEEFSPDMAKKIFIENKIELIPILDGGKKVIDFITWSDVFSEAIRVVKPTTINIPVVIMAGGKGTRMDPFNKIFPKPLIPIGDKPIIEIIIDEFRKQGVKKYYLTLNYKREMIESYLNSIKKDYEIKYVKETDFLGTIGSLKLLEKEIDDLFIVSNCDVIVKANFEEVINFHKEQRASLTILSALQHYKIPYGIIEFKEGGRVINVNEKPEYTFPINAGVYILNRDILRFMPEESSFDMTDLIKCLIKNNRKVVMYPVNENDYIDIGQWEEYKRAVEKLQAFR